MSTERDAGLAALQSGDVPTAITQLEAAIQLDATDYQAFLYLGAAYGQAERYMDAVRVLTQAVQLDPANAQARYNLGIAMEQAGYKDQALQVIQQALQLQPDYPKAQEALQRLQGTPPPSTPAAFGSTPTTTPGFGAPTSTPGFGTPTSTPVGGYTPPTTTPPANPPAFGTGGYPQTPVQTQGGMTGYNSQPPINQTPPYGQQNSPYGQQPPYGQQSPYGQQNSPYGGGMPPPPQACKEANEALIWGLVSFFCCIFTAPIAIIKANQAKKIIAANPYMTGDGMATGGLVLAIIAIVLNVVWFGIMILGALANGGR